MVCKKCARELDTDRFAMIRGKPGAVCKDCRNAYTREWRKTNTTWDQRGYHAEWRKRNRERLNAANKAWREANPEKMRAIRSEWVAKNPDKQRAIHRRYWDQRLHCPEFKLQNRIKARLKRALKCRYSTAIISLFGYSVAELSKHLERQFTKGMSWENMGEWHIDHIVPLSSFTITGPDDPELRRAWALPNLRPLWAAENLHKSSRRTHLI